MTLENKNDGGTEFPLEVLFCVREFAKLDETDVTSDAIDNILRRAVGYGSDPTPENLEEMQRIKVGWQQFNNEVLERQNRPGCRPFKWLARD